MEHPLSDLRNTKFPVHLSWGSWHSQSICVFCPPQRLDELSTYLPHIHCSLDCIHSKFCPLIENDLYLYIPIGNSFQAALCDKLPAGFLFLPLSTHEFIHLQGTAWWGMKVILYIIYISYILGSENTHFH